MPGDNSEATDSEMPTGPQSVEVAYESPRIETVLTAAELAREIKYAGDEISIK